MAKIQSKKININDFSTANRSDIEKLARSLNPFFDEVEKALRNTISYEYVTFDITVDSNGLPITATSLPINSSSVTGLVAVSATNINGALPTSAPFISFLFSQNVLKIQAVKGLPANTKFSLTVMIVS